MADKLIEYKELMKLTTEMKNKFIRIEIFPSKLQYIDEFLNKQPSLNLLNCKTYK